MKVLDDPKRRSIRRKLAPVIGDEDAENLVSALPSEDDDIVTKQFLRAELAENFALFRADVDDKFTTLRSDMDDKFTTLRSDMDDKFTTLRSDMDGKFATKELLKAELSDLKTEMAERFQKQTAWMCSTVLGGMAVIATITKLF